MLDAFRTEVDRVFDLATTSPHLLDGPYVSYRLVDGEYALFYHPDSRTEIYLGLRVDGSKECLVWWASFVSTALSGTLAAFGLPTPGGLIASLAWAIVSDPTVITILTTGAVLGVTFLPSTLLSLLKVLYGSGWLAQVFWQAVSGLSWWQAT